MTVIIREYGELKFSGDGTAGSVMTEGVLETDKKGTAIKTATPAASPGVDVRVGGSTNFVEMYNSAATAVQYAVRPKNRITSLIATANHRTIPAGGTVIEAVFGGAYINFTG